MLAKVECVHWVGKCWGWGDDNRGGARGAACPASPGPASIRAPTWAGRSPPGEFPVHGVLGGAGSCWGGSPWGGVSKL